jgi:hypothetical protein
MRISTSFELADAVEFLKAGVANPNWSLGPQFGKFAKNIDFLGNSTAKN